jgi:hypothetical protein
MTDGITLPGTGLNVDTEVSPNTSRHMQRVKLVLGAVDADGGDLAPGQAVMANSVPVVIASDQTAIPTSQSGAWTMGRTWSLSSSGDSVAAAQSGSWSVSIAGTATVSGTVTANLGTLNGAATASAQASILTALGSPFQAGGSIGNTSFGISGSLPAGSNAIGAIVGQRPFEAILSVTRPANTTAYAAGQVLSTATSGLTAFPTFPLGIGNSQRFTINDVTLVSSNGAASTKGQFAVYLFSSASPSGGGFNDASTFAATAQALAAAGNALIGILGVLNGTLAQSGTAAYGYTLGVPGLQGQTDSGGNVYAAIVLGNAYTPASGEVVYLKVTGVY